MRKLNEYLVTIDTIHPDNDERDHVFRDSCDMLDARPFPRLPARTMPGKIFCAISVWCSKRQSRLSLRDLSPEQLRDIGISRGQTDEELDKSRLLSRLTRSL
ncbi:DUF1127 domain-containing protein [Agrobacterium larrymoorei]|uniref:DUF1127 domain-containing protein n=1 Tax=Agrobacterium larrymoorei TaxID=160699 RepID=UPI001571F83E|nr:DUF1127 domain-containing protein [Agrobacterium larrymoorei]NTJ42226.1 DUF1127 domain-containing protein [Agrobacterium larrymoorei]